MILKRVPGLFVDALVGDLKPGSIAAGLALGAIAGLIPPDSLQVFFLVVILCFSTANTVAGLLSAALVSLFASSFDPLFGAVGNLFLAQTPPLVGFWTRLSGLPFFPWTGFNNTVTLGATLFGAALAYPLYYFLIPWCEILSERITRKIHR